MEIASWIADLACVALEDFHGLVQLVIDRIFRLGFILRSGRCVFVLIRGDGVVDCVRHDNVRSNGRILNGLF